MSTESEKIWEEVRQDVLERRRTFGSGLSMTNYIDAEVERRMAAKPPKKKAAAKKK
tara:strand:+ start:10281 stop:10448 length:168 start_codon:yes stop_codon:yes gene_type:complete